MATAVINNANTNINPGSNSDTNTSSNITISNVKTPSTTNTNANANKNGSGTRRKIPNTLIIYLRTRIANYYKINFDPSMLVPKVNSHTVYIDPLVKYTKQAIKDIPSDAPKELLLTQFFLANQFDSLINRILSSFLSMQSSRTLEEAKADGVIDDNIELTLETLFKRNNQFYINNRPYTVVGRTWNKGDWEIDTKPVEKLITPFAPLKGDELESAERELNDLGAGVIRGNPSATGIKASNMDGQMTPSSYDGLNMYPDTPEGFEAEAAKNQLMSSTDLKLLDNIPDALYILKDGLIKNDPIGYEAKSNLMNPASPLTFIFLIDERQIMQFIEDQKSTNQSGINVYNNYIRAKTEVINETSVFFDLVMFEFGIKKKEFDDLITKFKKDVIALKDPQPQISINVVRNEVNILNAKKREYMKSLFDLSKALLNIFDKQQSYFDSLVALLTFTRTNYKQIIKYTRTSEPTLAYQCIDLDIQIYSSFTAKDIQNRNMLRRNGQPIPTTNPDITVYADAYSKTIADYKQKHAEWFNAAFLSQYVNGQGTQINDATELDKYKQDPCLIDVEHSQYTIYMFIIMLYAFINQSDIWRVYFGPISTFISKMQQEAQTKLDTTKAKMDAYDVFVKNPRIRAISEDEVFEDIKKKQEAKTKAKTIRRLQLTEQEQQYFDLTEIKIESCEYITLYINSLELLCLRKNCLYISDENINQIYIEIADSSDKYYDNIRACFLTPSLSTSATATTSLASPSTASRTAITLPKAIMWGTDKINTKPTIEARIKSNDALKSLYISKKNAIKHSIDDLETYCEQIYKLISPVIDANGIKQQCAELVAKDPKLFLKMPQYVPRLQKWILNELKEYDEPTSNELNSQCKKIGSIYKRQGFKFTTSYQDWVALKNDADLAELDKDHYNDIYSIIKKLNGQGTTATGAASSFNPGLIIFELANPEEGSNNIKKGDYVLKKDKGSDDIYRVENDISPSSSTVNIVSITATTATPENVEISKLDKYLSIKVDCSKMQSTSASSTTATATATANDENPQFLFFVKTQLDPNVVQGLIPSLDDIPSEPKQAKYELVFNHSKSDNKLVYTVEDIPEDIVMFVSQQCTTPNLNQAIASRARNLQVKPTSKPVIGQKDLVELEGYKNEKAIAEVQKSDILSDIRIANTCLQKMSGDFYKDGYKGKSIYQYLVEGGDKDIAQFLHDLPDHYNQYLNKEANPTASTTAAAITPITLGSSATLSKTAQQLQDLLSTYKDYDLSVQQVKDVIAEYDLVNNSLTTDPSNQLESASISNASKLSQVVRDLIGVFNKTFIKPTAKTVVMRQIYKFINDKLYIPEQLGDQFKTIKDALDTELIKTTDPVKKDFSVIIPTFRTGLQKYIEFLRADDAVVTQQIKDLTAKITPLETQLKDDGINVKDDEYKIQRQPVTTIDEMKNISDLETEETKVDNMLRKINDVLSKTKNPDLTEKYTKYKSEYDAKKLQIVNRKGQLQEARTADIVKKGKLARQKGFNIDEDEEDNSATATASAISGVKVGGDGTNDRISPSEQYYRNGNVNAENQYNPYGQMGSNPYVNQFNPYGQTLPYGQTYGTQPYGTQPYGTQPYGQQTMPYGYPYNPQAQLMNLNQYSHSNRALELTSKLAYYVSVELELYPGKSANTIQMAAVKCSSTFERIREAWAAIMGYQYRPGTMSDSYTYQNLDPSQNVKDKGPNNKDPNNKEANQNKNPSTNPSITSNVKKNIRGGSIKYSNKNKSNKNKSKKRSVSCKIYRNN